MELAMSSIFNFGNKVKKEVSQEREKLKSLMDEIRTKVTVGAKFEKRDVVIDFNIPKNFVRFHEGLDHGVVEWREFFVDKKQNIISAQNRWAANSNMSTHSHPDCKEKLYVIHGMLGIITYHEDGTIKDKLELRPRDPEYVIQPGVPHYAYTKDEDTHFVVKFIKV
jgi:glucosamine 6-phosphate synthetase-like amidotransferase/phosphosugar isomerase protein